MTRLKHLQISSLLERRILKGDYAKTGLPAERDLAEEIGVSRVTLRKALDELGRKGLVIDGGVTSTVLVIVCVHTAVLPQGSVAR